jgi:ferredoxin
MSEDRRAEIEARLAAATPGEWVTDFHRKRVGVGCKKVIVTTPCNAGYYEKPQPIIANCLYDDSDDAENADFIANAPADLRWCLDAIAALTAERDELRAQVEAARGDAGGLPTAADIIAVSRVFSARWEEMRVRRDRVARIKSWLSAQLALAMERDEAAALPAPESVPDGDADREANPLPDQDECEACENGTDACPRHALEIHESWHEGGMFWIRGELCHEGCPGVKRDRERVSARIRDAAAKLGGEG